MKKFSALLAAPALFAGALGEAVAHPGGLHAHDPLAVLTGRLPLSDHAVVALTICLIMLIVTTIGFAVRFKMARHAVLKRDPRTAAAIRGTDLFIDRR